MSGFLVFMGGGAGATLRYLLSGLLPAPWAIVAINLIGSFGLAIILHPATGLSEDWQLALGVGAMGGFTTYSSFNTSMLGSLQRGEYQVFFGELVFTMVGALLAGSLGWWLAGWIKTVP